MKKMTLNSVINLNERQNSCFFYKEMTVNHLKNYFPLEYKFSLPFLVPIIKAINNTLKWKTHYLLGQIILNH